MRAGRREQARDPQEWPAVFLVRRRVHDDEAAAVVDACAPIAPEARVRRGGRERGAVRGELRAEPALELDESEIHCDLRRIMTLFALEIWSDFPSANFSVR